MNWKSNFFFEFPAWCKHSLEKFPTRNVLNMHKLQEKQIKFGSFSLKKKIFNLLKWFFLSLILFISQARNPKIMDTKIFKNIHSSGVSSSIQKDKYLHSGNPRFCPYPVRPRLVLKIFVLDMSWTKNFCCISTEDPLYFGVIFTKKNFLSKSCPRVFEL